MQNFWFLVKEGDIMIGCMSGGSMFTGTTREMFEVFSSVTAGCQIQATSRGDGTRIVLDVSSRAMATSQIDPGDSYPFQPQWLTFVGWRILSNLRTPEAALTETKREPRSDPIGPI